MLLVNLLDRRSPLYRQQRKMALARRRSKTWRQDHPDKFKAQMLKYKPSLIKARIRRIKQYGLTDYQFDHLMIVQGNVCAGCKKPPLPGRVLSIDHDHATDEVRGLLCDPCNMAVGLAHDSPTTLRNLADYLEKV